MLTNQGVLTQYMTDVSTIFANNKVIFSVAFFSLDSEYFANDRIPYSYHVAVNIALLEEDGKITVHCLVHAHMKVC